eukprot:3185731-Amphidinium_carterae.1
MFVGGASSSRCAIGHELVQQASPARYPKFASLLQLVSQHLVVTVSNAAPFDLTVFGHHSINNVCHELVRKGVSDSLQHVVGK